MTRFSWGVALGALTLVSACGLPRSGPTKGEIFAGSVLKQGDAFVITVTDRVNQIASATKSEGFSSKLRNASKLGADTIRPGDTLSLMVWENVEDGLLSGKGQNSTTLSELQVDDSGFVFVPYAGRIRAAGNTPEAIRRIITNKLKEQTPDPQVQVMRKEGRGASVTILGTGGGQAVLPIERGSRSLLQAVTQAGGVAARAGAVRITVIRGSQRESMFYSDILKDPKNDIALRNGDTIIVDLDERRFIALGATGTQSELKFDRANISGLEALAQVGGLNPATADPTGVFVLRTEDEAITEAITGVDVTGPQRVVYVLNLTEPNGMFKARDFLIRDGDTVYVTEAPFVQFNKTIAALTGSLASANNLTKAAQTVTGTK